MGVPPTPPTTAVAPALTSPSGPLSPAAPGSAAGPGRSAASGAQHPPRSAKAKGAAGGCTSAAGGPPGCTDTPTYLGCAAVGHHVHLGDKLWKLKGCWKDRQRSLWGASLELPSRGCRPTGMSHARLRKTGGRSGFQAEEQPRCWRLSAALQGILEMWTKARTTCRAPCGGWPWSYSTRRGKTDPETS